MLRWNWNKKSVSEYLILISALLFWNEILCNELHSCNDYEVQKCKLFSGQNVEVRVDIAPVLLQPTLKLEANYFWYEMNEKKNLLNYQIQCEVTP